ncbi:hypothetical protein [Streptococcus saliviloxodontae]|uniref:hypothetical protein n=1 Tax=Streptococcus saliviloxodontae TaxID=1349416 RepID=UPI001961DD05|nr:hypothetical protein [Streptococcus saliviloxodontae]
MGGIAYNGHNQLLWVATDNAKRRAQTVSISLKELEDYDLEHRQKPVTLTSVTNLAEIK